MDPNFNRLRQRFENTPGGRGFNNWRQQFRRSYNGKFLGVFSGIAESKGLCVRKVRWIGIGVLLFLATSVADTRGATATMLVCGFFYLVAALLMRSPQTDVGRMTPPPTPAGPVPSAPYPGSAGYYHPQPAPGGGGMRPDFAAIDRQLDGLSRRIQRMETIVTDRGYDWDRRMGS